MPEAYCFTRNHRSPDASGPRISGNLVRPDLEVDQRVRAEGERDRYVGRVAALGNQHAANSRYVVARIKSVPMPAEISLEPGGEVHWAIRRRHADFAEVAGAIARRNVHAAAEGHGEMHVVATHALAFFEHLPGALGRARVLVAKGDVAMDEIANCLEPSPSQG